MGGEQRGEFCRRAKTEPFPYFRRQIGLEHPNASIALYEQYTWFCVIICLTFGVLQLKSTFDFGYFSCKYFEKAKYPERDCSRFDLNDYFLGPQGIAASIPQDSPKKDLSLFSSALELYLVLRIILLLLVSALPFVFLYYHFKLLHKLRKKQKGLRIADYVIMVVEAKISKKSTSKNNLGVYSTRLDTVRG